MAGLIRATLDKETKRKLRYNIEENDYEISGTIYIPKEAMKGKKNKPQRLLVKVAFDRD